MDTLVFKHEAELDGEPIGPVSLRRAGQDGARKLALNKPAPQWFTLTEAKAEAARLGVELREV